MENGIILIFQLVVLIFSVMIHEISHGAVALKLGDPTAKNAGRLTLNPLRHIDPFGSVLLPLFLVLINSPFLIGWAKPVPYNPLHLKNPKKGAGLIGAAGPLSNILVAVVFGVLLRLLAVAPAFGAAASLALFLNIIILINILLALFNLVPLPPLDGSNVLFAFLPGKYYRAQEFLMRYGFLLLIFFILFGIKYLFPIMLWLYRLIAGSGALY